MKSKTSTRIVSVVLLVAMIFSCMNLPIAAVSFNGESDYKTKTGILVAENYGSLNAYEKAILSSKALSGDSYSGKIPVNESLVTIDSENKTVTAAEASGSDGVSRWIPVSCEVFYKAADGNVFAVIARQGALSAVTRGESHKHAHDNRYDCQKFFAHK